MNKHTPGPWNRIKGDRNVYSAAGTVCKTPAILGGGSAATNWEANARLICAAPDLLDAAQLALQIAESWIHDQLDGTSSIDGALLHLDPVRAAIARARGEA